MSEGGRSISLTTASLTPNSIDSDGRSSNPHLVVAVYVFVVSTFLMFVFFLIRRLRMREQNEHVATHRNKAVVLSREERFRDIEQGLINKHVYAHDRLCSQTDKSLPQELRECTICLEQFQVDEIVSWSAVCSHVFHHRCIKEWLYRHTNCPICRQGPLLSVDDRTAPQSVPLQSQRATTCWYCIEHGVVEHQDTVNKDHVVQERTQAVPSTEKLMSCVPEKM